MVCTELAEQQIPDPVREAYQDFLQDWTGEDMPLDRRWLEKPLARLPEEYHSMLELLLLITAAPYRVERSLIERFTARHPEPLVLLSTAAWASFSSARVIGSWMAQAPMAADAEALKCSSSDLV